MADDFDRKKKLRIKFGEYFIYADRYNYVLAEVKDDVTGEIDILVDLKKNSHSFFPTLPMLFDHLLNRRLKESEISDFKGLEDSIIRITALLNNPFKASQGTTDVV